MDTDVYYQPSLTGTCNQYRSLLTIINHHTPVIIISYFRPLATIIEQYQPLSPHHKPLSTIIDHCQPLPTPLSTTIGHYRP